MTKEQAIKLLSKDTSIDEIHRLRDKGLSHTEVTDAIQEAMDLGADAIEKTIAKNVIDIVEEYENYLYIGKCPICNTSILIASKEKYCSNCGQKLLWKESEN